MIYSVNEGLFDRFKKKNNINKVSKNSYPSKYKKEKISKLTFTREQDDEIYEKANEFFEKHWSKVIDISKKIISNSNVSAAYSFDQYYDYLFHNEDPWGINLTLPGVSSSPIGYNLWNIEPNARTEYKKSPTVKEVYEINKKIIDAIEGYFNKIGIKAKVFETGDWDTAEIDIYIPIKELDLSFSIDNLYESTIFESVKFI